MSRKAAFHPASISVVIERFPDVGIDVDHMPTAELETTAAGHFQTHHHADLYRCPPGLGVISPPGCSVNSEKTQFDTQAPSLARLRRNLTLDRGRGAQRAALTRYLCPVSTKPSAPWATAFVAHLHGCLRVGTPHGQGLTTAHSEADQPTG
jgi:hypothetical protein